jgi:hypothetical protein
MNKYLVFSFNREDMRIHMDCAATPNSDAALQCIANIRRTSDVIVALQPDQLRELADKLDRFSLEQIDSAQAAALREETEHQTNKLQPAQAVTSVG